MSNIRSASPSPTPREIQASASGSLGKREVYTLAGLNLVDRAKTLLSELKDNRSIWTKLADILGLGDAETVKKREEVKAENQKKYEELRNIIKDLKGAGIDFLTKGKYDEEFKTAENESGYLSEKLESRLEDMLEKERQPLRERNIFFDQLGSKEVKKLGMDLEKQVFNVSGINTKTLENLKDGLKDLGYPTSLCDKTQPNVFRLYDETGKEIEIIVKTKQDVKSLQAWLNNLAERSKVLRESKATPEQLRENAERKLEELEAQTRSLERQKKVLQEEMLGTFESSSAQDSTIVFTQGSATPQQPKSQPTAATVTTSEQIQATQPQVFQAASNEPPKPTGGPKPPPMPSSGGPKTSAGSPPPPPPGEAPTFVPSSPQPTTTTSVKPQVSSGESLFDQIKQRRSLKPVSAQSTQTPASGAPKTGLEAALGQMAPAFTEQPTNVEDLFKGKNSAGWTVPNWRDYTKTGALLADIEDDDKTTLQAAYQKAISRNSTLEDREEYETLFKKIAKGDWDDDDNT